MLPRPARCRSNSQRRSSDKTKSIRCVDERYGIQRAVEDKATVPIYFEGRLAKLELKPEERPKNDPNFEQATEDEELITRKSSRRSGRRWRLSLARANASASSPKI